MTASGQSDEYEGCVSDEISSHDVAISKKKSVASLILPQNAESASRLVKIFGS